MSKNHYDINNNSIKEFIATIIAIIVCIPIFILDLIFDKEKE